MKAKLKKILKKKALLNVVSSLLLQLATIISGFIVQRIVLEYFGSDANGLVSSLTQFLSYVSLIEGGLSSVIMTSLYKPLHDKNDEKISAIMKTSTNFFRKISAIHIVYSVALAIIYPLLSNTGFSFAYVASLTMILSFMMLLQYMFSVPYQTLLKADRATYVVSLTQVIITVLNVISAVAIVNIFPNMHVFKIVASALYIIQPIVYSWYIRKHYNINRKTKIDNNLIKNRWNGFGINVAAFIHNNTDVAILTIFTDLRVVSVYAVYALVTTGLKRFIQAIASAMAPSIGRIYASGDSDLLDKKFGIFEYMIFILVFYIFTLAALLITPFVMIYTNGINDADYYQPLFGVLIVLSEALYLIKFAHLHLSYVADRYRDITKPAILEAVLNIVLSLVLVQWLGMNGVMIGTIVAMAYRMVFHVWYTKKIIPLRVQWKFYARLLGFCIATLMAVMICVVLVPPIEYNIWNWLWHAVIYAVVLLVGYGLFSIICCRDEVKGLSKYMKN
ncbi:MAG: oligosaccharide flippase family protein [Candidatus Saccharibacteria bacterium]|nr:oligosaccharide flippase family protein [Candidatus Saccharibacteria bacterium]